MTIPVTRQPRGPRPGDPWAVVPIPGRPCEGCGRSWESCKRSGHLSECPIEWWRMDDGSIYESVKGTTGAAWLVTAVGQRPGRSYLIQEPAKPLVERLSWLWYVPIVVAVIAWAMVLAVWVG